MPIGTKTKSIVKNKRCTITYKSHKEYNSFMSASEFADAQ